ncbi:MAG: undecaprenyl-diphosphate phosphatase [Candidatus Omnitrophica bacterium]|jgi:undecaprenyl-diphosphatase|nr:undecaprenyl-diphosphate phosphatase [Candidatus Omnitrophota bacterium]
MLNYIILGIIQGLTEFLPVSSSAHLVIFGKILGLKDSGLLLSVVLHMGTLLSLLVFLFKDILGVFKDKKLIIFIFIVTLVTGVIGIGLKDFIEKLFSCVWASSLSLLVTGLILLSTKAIKHSFSKGINFKDGIILGLTQGIAVIPGISRSGITISTLLFRGFSPVDAFKVSFLASLPAIFGAGLLEFKDINARFQDQALPLFIGFIFSFIFGLSALYIVKKLLRVCRFYYFGYYCIIMGMFALLFVR